MLEGSGNVHLHCVFTYDYALHETLQARTSFGFCVTESPPGHSVFMTFFVQYSQCDRPPLRPRCAFAAVKLTGGVVALTMTTVHFRVIV